MNQDKATGVKVGDVIPWQSLVGQDDGCRVMAIAEGWALVRRKGCVPFALYLREWAQKNPEFQKEGG